MNNLALGQTDLPRLKKMRQALNDLLAQAHDDFLPGTRYADWYDDERNLIRTALGPVQKGACGDRLFYVHWNKSQESVFDG